MRATTLADARKMGLLPSCTTLIKLLAAPNLVQYQVECALLSGVRLYPTMTEIERAEEDKKMFMQRVLEDSYTHRDTAAETGSAIHSEIESWIVDHSYQFKPEWEQFCLPFCDYFNANIGEVVAVEKVLADAELGLAGRTDLIAYHKQHGLTVFDWKTKNVKPYKGKKTGAFYDNHILQLSAYSRMIARQMGVSPDLRCVNLIIDVGAPGVFEKIWEVGSEKETMTQQWAWSVMESLIELWRRKNNYFPSRTAPTNPQ